MDMIYNTVEVLLVEDNPDDAELTVRALRRHQLGSRLVHVWDGVEALEFMFATGKYDSVLDAGCRPKLVLMDVNMPRLNGIEVLRAIRTDERTKSIPVVMLTSSKEDSDVRTCYKLGANSYVVKPVNYEIFNQTLHDLGSYWLHLNQPPVK
jgi:two-component system response regulator